MIRRVSLCGNDIGTPSQYASKAGVTPSTPPKNFYVATAIADIVSVNGQAAKGTYVGRSREVVLSPTPADTATSEAIADVTRAATMTASAARGDFSGSIYPLWDYLTCDPGAWVCLAFPLSLIPQPRLAPGWVLGVQTLPVATNLTSAGFNAVADVSGCLADLMPAGNASHLALGSQNGAIPATFGGFQQLALGYSNTRSTTFALYVDGVKIATNAVAYEAPSRQ